MAADTAPPPLTGLDDPHAANRRVMRTFSMFVSVGYLIYGVLCIPLIIAAVPLAATWWTVVAVILTLGTGLAMGVLSRRADIPRIRIVSGTACAGFLLATALFWPAWNGTLISTVQGIWFAQFPGLAAIAAVIAVRTSVGSWCSAYWWSTPC